MLFSRWDLQFLIPFPGLELLEDPEGSRESVCLFVCTHCQLIAYIVVKVEQHCASMTLTWKYHIGEHCQLSRGYISAEIVGAPLGIRMAPSAGFVFLTVG